MKKFIIFDFDGTLADTLELNLEIIKDLKLAKNKEITPTLIEEFKNTTVLDFLKKNKISKLKMYLNFSRIKREQARRINEAQPFPGIKSTIGKMYRSGYRLGILSSNDHRNINLFLKQNKIRKFFDFIYTEKNIFSKDIKLKLIVKILKLNDSDVIYIGDEIRDIEAAHKAGIKVIAVSWGYNNQKLLEKFKPTKIVQAPRELLKAVKQIDCLKQKSYH